jgi:hypothetical protein
VLTAGSGEEVGDEPGPLEGDDLLAGGGEHALEPLDRDVGDDPVQGLAVEVDDPQQLAREATWGSATASQMAPSSSSASPSRLTKRPAGGVVRKWERV